jgi:hypothetical protein
MRSILTASVLALLPLAALAIGYLADPSVLSMLIADLVGGMVGSLLDPLNLALAIGLGLWRTSALKWLMICIVIIIVYSIIVQYFLIGIGNSLGITSNVRVELVVYRFLAILWLAIIISLFRKRHHSEQATTNTVHTELRS